MTDRAACLATLREVQATVQASLKLAHPQTGYREGLFALQSWLAAKIERVQAGEPLTTVFPPAPGEALTVVLSEDEARRRAFDEAAGRAHV